MRRIGMTMMLVLCGFIAIHAQQSLHVVMLGDSNTFIGGDDCSKPQGWNKWFKDLMNPLSCHSYARSGATWTETPNTVYDINEYTEVLSDNNVIYNQVSRLLADVFDTKTQPIPDLILIMAGTNDLWFASKRPEPLSKYIRQNCEMLKDAFPKARIVLITPPPFTKVSEEVQHQAAAMIEQSGKELQEDVIRLDQTTIFQGDGYFKDGVHTTVKGAQVLGKYIYEQVEALLPQ